MMIFVGAALVLAYVVLAIVVARFCGVNRDWEEAVEEMPEEFPFEERRESGVEPRPVALSI